MRRFAAGSAVISAAIGVAFVSAIAAIAAYYWIERSPNGADR